MKIVLCLFVVFAVQSLALASDAKTIVKKLVSEEDVAMALAEYIANLSLYQREKGTFSVVLSGAPLIRTLRKLLEAPYNSKIDWSKWVVFWVDERVVPLYDSLSNYKLALHDFLFKVPIPQSSIYPIHYMKSPAAVAGDYEARLKKLAAEKVIPLSAAGFPKFDLILLGIGSDGHVASLFPNRTQRYEKKRWVTFITDSPKPPPERITFTFPVINSASNIAVVVTEAEAADAVAATLGGGGGVCPPLPCAEVRAEEELTWFLDKEAASKLK